MSFILFGVLGRIMSNNQMGGMGLQGMPAPPGYPTGKLMFYLFFSLYWLIAIFV